MAYSTIPLMESPDEDSLMKELDQERGKLKVQEDPKIKASDEGINSVYLENSDKVILYTGSDLKAVSRNEDGTFLKDLRFGNNITSLEREVSL
jgi:hypothetical protein